MYATLIWYIVSSSSDRWVLTPRLRVIQIGEGDPQLAPARPREDLGGRSGGAAQTREEATSGRGPRMRGETTKGLLTRCPRHQSRVGAPMAACFTTVGTR